MKLQSKIILSLIPLIGLPLLIVGWISFTQLKQTTELKTANEVRTILRQLETLIEEKVRTAEANALLFSKSGLLQKYLLTGDEDSRYGLLQPTLLRLFASYQEAYPDYYEIRVLLPDGFEDARLTSGGGNVTEDESRTPFFREMAAAESDLYLRVMINPDNGKPALLVGRKIILRDRAQDPITSAPSLRGYLLLTVSLDSIAAELGKRRVGREGVFYLADTAGTILFHPSDGAVGGRVPEVIMARIASQGDEPHIFGEQVAGHVNSFCWARPAGDLLLIAQIPENEVVGSSRRLGGLVTLVTLLAIILVSALFFYITRRLLLAPIVKLNEAAREFGRGNFAHPIGVQAADEMGELAEALQAMGQNLDEFQRQIKYVAYHDSLTGLPNRMMFNEYLDHCLAYARRMDNVLALLFIDIDNFKRINDTLGHDVGDKLLQEVSSRFQKTLRKEDYVMRAEAVGGSNSVARLGGDEFTLILPHVRNPYDVVTVARRLLAEVAQPLKISGHEIFVTASMGIATFPQDGGDATTLIKNADTAMYQAKAEGKNDYRYYSESMNVAALERLTMESNLRRAIERQEFVLFYQPMVQAKSLEIIGVEALIRWQHPEFGMVPPVKFIPLAEESGLIVPIGEWVIGEACRQMKRWVKAGMAPHFVSVNLSSQQFRRQKLSTLIDQILRETELAPRYLDVELTESSIMEAESSATKMLEEIKEVGVRVSLDDFGTGYSSLSYLRRFPIDTLKIDRSFVRNAAGDRNDAAIISAIIALAQVMELEVVAEGVEGREQFEFLRDKGCDLIQGYLFSPPLPEGEVGELLRRGCFTLQ